MGEIFTLVGIGMFLILALFLYFSKLPKNSVGRRVTELVLILVGAISIVFTFTLESQKSKEFWSKIKEQLGKEMENQLEENGDEIEQALIEINKPEDMEYVMTIDGIGSRLLLYENSTDIGYEMVALRGKIATEGELEIGDSLSRNTNDYFITVVNRKGSDEYFLIVNAIKKFKVKDSLGTEIKEHRTKDDYYFYTGSFKGSGTYMVTIGEKDYEFKL